MTKISADQLVAIINEGAEGTVVGIAIVKRIMDNNKGEIKVESEVNKGTVFKLYFRVKEEINIHIFKQTN